MSEETKRPLSDYAPRLPVCAAAKLLQLLGLPETTYRLEIRLAAGSITTLRCWSYAPAAADKLIEIVQDYELKAVPRDAESY